MSRIPVVYFAHPVGAADAAGVAANLAAARRWFARLLDLWPNVAIVASWLPYLDVLEDSGENRRRGLRDDLAIGRRCDGIVLCGPVLSSGMTLELESIRGVGGFVVDLVGVDLDDLGTILERLAAIDELARRSLTGSAFKV